MKKHELYHNGKSVVEVIAFNRHDVWVRLHGGETQIMTRKYFEQNFIEVY